jgi:hypothetical protein
MSRPDLDTLGHPLDPVTVFYDCEFTDLTSDSDLLSIGFVACDFEAELYIEVSDANFALASLFVGTEVLPLFGRHTPEVLTRAAAATRIKIWLDGLREGNRGRQIILVSDSQWDWAHFLQLFPPPLPGQIPWAKDFNLVDQMVQRMLGSSGQMTNFEEEIESYHRTNRERHHALVDARGLRAAFLESSFS